MDPAPLHLLCIEPRFPGRLGPVADWLVRRRGYRCQFFCNSLDRGAFWPESLGHGLDIILFNVGGVARGLATDWTRLQERGLCYAYGAWEVLMARRPSPVDLVLGRSAGLGSTLFVPVFQPGVPIVNLFDYYLAPRTGDLADEDAATMPAGYIHWRRSANAMDLIDLENSISPWVPTAWQRDRYPVEYRNDFLVLFDGIDARRLRRPSIRPRVIAGRTIPSDARVVTFVARCTDRRRGFERFVNLVNRLMRAGENVIGIAVGAPVVGDGIDIRFFNQDYRAHVMSQDPPPQPERLWFLDVVQPSVVADVLAASDLHVYSSRSLPVSRSLPEAMAAGCVILAWDTPAVREFVTPDHTGLLLSREDMDRAEDVARRVLHDPAAYRPLADAAAEQARATFAQDVTLPRLAAHFDILRTGRQ